MTLSGAASNPGKRELSGAGNLPSWTLAVQLFPPTHIFAEQRPSTSNESAGDFLPSMSEQPHGPGVLRLHRGEANEKEGRVSERIQICPRPTQVRDDAVFPSVTGKQ